MQSFLLLLLLLQFEFVFLFIDGVLEYSDRIGQLIVQQIQLQNDVNTPSLDGRE